MILKIKILTTYRRKKHEFICQQFYNRKNGISYATLSLLDKYPCKTYFDMILIYQIKIVKSKNKNFNLNVIKLTMKGC